VFFRLEEDQCAGAGLSGLCIAELLELRPGSAPIRSDTHPELEVDLMARELLDAQAGLRADALEHLTGLTNQDALLTGLFNPDGGIDMNGAPGRGGLDEAVDDHGHGVRHFGLRGAEDLLAHILGREKARRTIGHLVRAIAERARGAELGDLVEHAREAILAERGDGHDRSELADLGQGLEQREQAALVLDAVDLVDHEQGRLVRADVREQGQVAGVGRERALELLRFARHGLFGAHERDVGDEDDHVGVTGRVAGRGVHDPAELGARSMDAGGIEQGDLGAVVMDDAEDGVAGGLRRGRDDGQRLLERGVEEGGFADIGAADEGDLAATRRAGLFPGLGWALCGRAFLLRGRGPGLLGFGRRGFTGRGHGGAVAEQRGRDKCGGAETKGRKGEGRGGVLGRQIVVWAGDMTKLLHFEPPAAMPPSDKRLLLVFDGGDAPGYSSVAVALTEEGSRRGYEVWAATEGFRSLTEDATAEPRFERLIVSRRDRYALLAKGIPARSMGRRVLDAGSDFRSERYLGFYEQAKRKTAAETFRAQGFSHLIGVGGNGTFEGLKAWLGDMQERPRTGFINVSVDNDLGGDRAIGFLTGVEAGATIARGLYEDAYTHKRVYLLEMMGNRSGRHALHCGVAARAHLIVLPFFQFPDDVLCEIAENLSQAEYALVVVAEGYERERRRREYPGLSASAFFKMQLEEKGLKDSPQKRVIAEPFSRYLRGVRPAFLDVSAAYLKASLLFDAFDLGHSEVMPFVVVANDVGVRTFASINREDRVERALLPLLSRFKLERFTTWIRNHFTSEGTTL